MLPYADVDTCNMALVRIGAGRIVALDENSVNAQECRFYYDKARDLLMAAFLWNFALKRATLAQSATDPDFEFENQFEIPSDMLWPWELYNTTTAWVREGDFILTNDSEANLKYIARIVDTTKFSPGFFHALSLLIGMKLFIKIANKGVTSFEALEKEFREVLGQAQLKEVQSGNRDQTESDNLFSWITGRL